MNQDINQLRTQLTVHQARVETYSTRVTQLAEENQRLRFELDKAEKTVQQLRVELAELTRPQTNQDIYSPADLEFQETRWEQLRQDALTEYQQEKDQYREENDIA